MMTDTQGLIAGMFLLFALVVYTFWLRMRLRSQKEKSQLDYLLERKEHCTRTFAIEFEYKAGKYPEEDFQVQRAQLEDEASHCWLKLTCCSIDRNCY